MARRTSTTRLIKLLRSSSHLLYVVDEQRKLVFCNQACCDWLECGEADLVGKHCDYQSSDAASQTVDGLCPPPETFLGQVTQTTITPPTSAASQSVVCIPLSGTTSGEPETGPPGGVLVIGMDSTAWPRQQQAADPTSIDLHEQLQQLRQQLGHWFQLEQLIGHTPSLQRIRDQILLASQSRSRVLIIGPPGSSREQFGRVIHYQGQGHAPSTIVPLSCTLLDTELIESTVTAFLSRFANLQTDMPPALLLLDVDELALDAQAMLVGVLGIAEFELQTIATARQPLVDLARKGGFRYDLANMLSTLVIEIPPLAEHLDDVPLMAQYFLEQQNERRANQLSGFSDEALDALAAYDWPRNLSELRDVVRRSCDKASGNTVGGNDLPEKIHFAMQAVAYPRPIAEPIDLDSYLAGIEEELIRRALEQAGGNKTRAAGLLGITRARLHRRASQIQQKNDGPN